MINVVVRKEGRYPTDLRRCLIEIYIFTLVTRPHLVSGHYFQYVSIDGAGFQLYRASVSPVNIYRIYFFIENMDI